MSLDTEQEQMQAKIKKSATTAGVICGVIVGLIAFWALGGQSTAIRLVGSVVIAIVVGFGIFKWRFGANSDSAKCAKCGEAYSITRTDRVETVTGSEAKEEREKQEDGSTKVATWTEEKYNVTETYTCSKCSDVTTKESSSSRRKDVEETVVPKPAAAKAADQRAERAAQSGHASKDAPISKAEPTQTKNKTPGARKS